MANACIPDPRLVTMAEGCVNTVRGHHVETPVMFYAYLCPDCSNTHVVIACEALNGVQINAEIKPLDAERLGALISNPRVAQETEA